MAKITLVVSSLGAGGAERVLTGIANWLVGIGHKVTLITWSGKEDSDFYPLSPNVKRVCLDVAKVNISFLDSFLDTLKRLIKLRRALKKSNPDVCLSFIEKVNIYFLLASIGLPFRKVVSERNDPSLYRNAKKWLWLRKLSYPLANVVVVQSEKASKWIISHVKAKRVEIIPNALDHNRLNMMLKSNAEPDGAENSERIVCVGRLHPDKGHARLFHACKYVFQKHPDWKLDIIGQGELEESLSQLADKLGIKSNVEFHGLLKNPFPLVKRAEIFVLPSLVEGFPNVLIEAMALEKACVCFDCLPVTVVDSYRNGIVVKDNNIQQFAEAICLLIEDETLRKKVQKFAGEVKDAYSEHSVMNMWLSVLEV